MQIDCQWGLSGASQPADVAIIVDVLSFSTSVAIAAERGARVFPYWGEEGEALAALVGGRLASKVRSLNAPSLSPASLTQLRTGEALVLPSLNGARCSLAATAEHVFCGSLRNAAAVAKIAADAGQRVLVAPAGEAWPDGSLRVAFEDQVGAGAIIARLREAAPDAILTPEARAALVVFEDSRGELLPRLLACQSGHELTRRGFPEDVELAAQLDASAVAPMLMMHRSRYRVIAADGPMASHRIRFFEDAANGWGLPET